MVLFTRDVPHTPPTNTTQHNDTKFHNIVGEWVVDKIIFSNVKIYCYIMLYSHTFVFWNDQMCVMNRNLNWLCSAWSFIVTGGFAHAACWLPFPFPLPLPFPPFFSLVTWKFNIVFIISSTHVFLLLLGDVLVVASFIKVEGAFKRRGQHSGLQQRPAAAYGAKQWGVRRWLEPFQLSKPKIRY